MKFTPAGALKRSDMQRDAAKPHGGSLGATMNQGGSHSEPQPWDIPKLMGQAPEKLYAQTMTPLRRKLGQ